MMQVEPVTLEGAHIRLVPQYVISKDKGARDMALFSIIDREWPEVKAGLERKLRRV
jgi:hypothetical protein